VVVNDIHHKEKYNMGEYKEIFRYCEACNPSVTSAALPSFLSALATIRDNDLGYYASEKNKLVFCFAGSNDIKDWVSNFKFLPLEEGRTIHDGFYDSWVKFKDEVTQIVLKNKLPILCVGHSRGAALATLCARHIAKNLKIPCKLVVYGSPNIGNRKYRDEFELLPIDATKVVNGYDIVTHIPPTELGFYGVGKTINIKQNFWHHLMVLRISDHTNYSKALDKAGL
jgi:predicted lipase